MKADESDKFGQLTYASIPVSAAAGSKVLFVASSKPTPPLLVVAAWAAVGIPLAWGIYRTLISVASYF